MLILISVIQHSWELEEINFFLFLSFTILVFCFNLLAYFGEGGYGMGQRNTKTEWKQLSSFFPYASRKSKLYKLAMERVLLKK